MELAVTGSTYPSQLQECKNTLELRALISERCRGFAEVLNVTAICSKEGGNMMCVVDFIPGTPNLVAVTERIGGHVFGFNSVVIRLTPKHGFACPNGYPPKHSSCSCTPRD